MQCLTEQEQFIEIYLFLMAFVYFESLSTEEIQ